TRPPLPDRDNAAVLYRHALAHWPRLDDGRLITETRWDVDSTDPDPIADSAAYLASCAAVFDALRRAAEMPDADWHVQLTSPSFNVLLPHLGEMRELMRLIDDAARRAHEAGDDRLATELIHVMFDLADAVDVRPSFLITHMVANSIRVFTIARL